MHANAASRLLEHYVDKFRRLPWRSPPGSVPPDPYLVWLSEIMLQQTTVAAVAPRFERFIARWPNVEALAAASDAEVLSEWAGLGYYARAHNLIACAREVAARGGFPDSEQALRRLPGIGDYTAAAIAAIAFGRPAAAIDGNVERVIARLHALQAPSKPQVRALVEAMLPPGRAGDFAQAMMDLGATMCRPRRPSCGDCPLSACCLAFRSGAPELFPAPRARPARAVRHGIAWWIQRQGAVWLVRRPPHGLLGGMAALPGPDWTECAPELSPAPLARVRHLFTHIDLRLAVVAAAEPSGDGWWHPIDAIDAAGLPTLYRRAAGAVLAKSGLLAA